MPRSYQSGGFTATTTAARLREGLRPSDGWNRLHLAERQLHSPATALYGAVGIAKCCASIRNSLALRRKAQRLLKQYRQDGRHAVVIHQAMQLVTARAEEQCHAWVNARKRYQNVCRQHPDTEAAAFAQRRIRSKLELHRANSNAALMRKRPGREDRT